VEQFFSESELRAALDLARHVVRITASTGSTVSSGIHLTPDLIVVPTHAARQFGPRFGVSALLGTTVQVHLSHLYLSDVHWGEGRSREDGREPVRGEVVLMGDEPMSPALVRLETPSSLVAEGAGKLRLGLSIQDTVLSEPQTSGALLGAPRTPRRL